MKNITNSLSWNEFTLSLVLIKDRAISTSGSSNFAIAIAITLRSFFQVKIGDHLAIAKKRSPIARSAICHALWMDHFNLCLSWTCSTDRGQRTKSGLWLLWCPQSFPWFAKTDTPCETFFSPTIAENIGFNFWDCLNVVIRRIITCGIVVFLKAMFFICLLSLLRLLHELKNLFAFYTR